MLVVKRGQTLSRNGRPAVRPMMPGVRMMTGANYRYLAAREGFVPGGDLWWLGRPRIYPIAHYVVPARA